MRKPAPKKILMTHPRTRRQMKIDETIYKQISTAILQSLKRSKGKTFSELSEDVKNIVEKKFGSFKGAVPWYTISVRLNMETSGIIETFTEKGRKLNRLK